MQSILDTLCLEYKAIILCANAKNLPILCQCESFITLYKKLDSDFQSHTTNIKATQERMLKILNAYQQAICKEKHPFSILIYLNALKEARILTQHQYERFKATLLILEKKNIPLKVLSDKLASICERLKRIDCDKPKDALDILLEKLHHHHYSIGVTGVLSAGKSTFLNALLAQEILSASTVPETASLTILRYGEMRKAKVHFWNLAQWEEIRDSFEGYVKEIEAHFGTQIKQILSQKTREIDIEELSSYTSANHPSKLSALVQEVEIFVPLAFLRPNVEIVDTPGLDDPITKREAITRAYLSRCDMLIHVMNASCAASEVDIDFILESLLERNVARLLIVLTRIDLISKSALEESLAYTKQSIASRLRKARFSGDIDTVLSRLDFIPLSSYVALLHRTNRQKEAQDTRLSLEECGINEVEAYLNNMLLGEDSLKNRDKLYKAYRSCLQYATRTKDLLQTELELMGADAESLSALIKAQEDKHKALLDTLKTTQTEMERILQDIRDYLQNLRLMGEGTLSKHINLLQERLVQDVLYANSQKKKPDSVALGKMVEIGLKDCFIDVGREYRYNLACKITQLTSHLYKDEEESINMPQIQLTSHNIDNIIAPFLRLIPQLVKPSSHQALHQALQEAFSVILGDFKSLLDKQGDDINATFFAHFDNIAKWQKQRVENDIKMEQEHLHIALKKREDGKNSNLIGILEHHIQTFNEIIDELHTHIATFKG